MIRLTTRGKVLLWSLILLATAAGFVAFRLSGRTAGTPDVMAPTVSTMPGGHMAGLFVRSLVLAATATLFAAAIALPTGLSLGASTASWWAPLLLFPLLMPPHLSAYIWRFTLEDITRTILPGAALWPHAWTRFLGASWTLSALYWPLIALPVALAMRLRGNRLQEELATLAPPGATFRGAVLPGLAPMLLGGMGLVFLMSLANYGVPLMWNIPTQNVAVFARLAAYYQPGPALRLSIPLQVTVLAVCAAGMIWLRGKDYGLDLTQQPRSGRATRSRWPSICVGTTLFVTVVLPLVSLMVLPNVFKGIRPSFVAGFPALGWGLALALIGATSAAAIGSALAFLLDRRPRLSMGIEFVGLCALFLPATVLCVILLKTLTPYALLRKWVYGSLAVFAVAYGIRFFYIPWKLSQSALRSRSVAYRDVERMLGLSWPQRVRLTLGGLMKPMVLMGWLFVFALTLGELEIAAFLVQPGRQPLGVFLDNLMHYGRSATVVHWSLILIAVELFISVLVLKLGRSTWQRCSATT